MLSYQHLYHAGNLADVQKHAVLAWVLDYLTRKKAADLYRDPPGAGSMTGGGRGGEPAKRRGIALAERLFRRITPYRQRLRRRGRIWRAGLSRLR
jgi:23S rRNA (adenine2030-N6)-methyltransferase